MSPASYRAAPPRVGSATLPSGPGPQQIGGPGPRGRRYLVGDGLAPPASRCSAASALAIASLSRCCAWPYLVKSPAFSAASASADALLASLSACCSCCCAVPAALGDVEGDGDVDGDGEVEGVDPSDGGGAVPPPPFWLASVAQAGLSVEPVC